MAEVPAERDRPARGTWTALLLSLGLVTTGVVVVSRWVAGGFWGNSLIVLAVAVLVAARLSMVRSSLAPRWDVWRRLISVVVVVTVTYPGVWAAAAIADQHAPGSRLTWALAVVAGTAYLPLLAAFTLFPLLAIRYLGSGSTRLPAVLTIALFALAAVTFALFFDEFDPFAASALIESDVGAAVGFGINTLAVSSVLVGPAWALVAAWRSSEGAARRLSLVAAAALSGVAVVMVCSVVGAAANVGATVVVCGLFLALWLLVARSSHALTTTAPSDGGAPDSGGRAMTAPRTLARRSPRRRLLRRVRRGAGNRSRSGSGT